MKDYKYIIVGGGMAGDAAVRGIRSVDPSGPILLVTTEPYLPYNRPPLSKGLWKGKPLSRIWRKTDELGAEILLSTSVVGLNPAAHLVTDQTGNQYRYKKLLLATGGQTRTLSYQSPKIYYLRTLDDYQALRHQVDAGKRFAVLGGGFIGPEIAAVLRENGKETAMIFSEPGIASRIFPPDIYSWINSFFKEKGVHLFPECALENVQENDAGLKLSLRSSGNEIIEVETDALIAGIGLLPNTILAEQAGLEVSNGIVVNAYLQTSDPDIYSAGDVASYWDDTLQMRRRVEHEDQANISGMTAGKNMAGAQERYLHLPYFYSDVFDIGYEAVGELDARMDFFADWQDPFRKGVMYYLRDGRVRGVLLWNTWGKLDAAREIIRMPGPLQPQDLKGWIS